MTTSSGSFALGTSYSQVASCGVGNETILFGLVFTNTTSAQRTVTLQHFVQATAQTLTYDFDIPARSRATWGPAIGLQPGDTLSAKGDTAGVTALVSINVDTGSVPLAAGFNPRGAYAAGSTYAVNDVVSYSSSSYVSMVAGNIGHQPDTSTTQWMLLVGPAAGVSASRQIATSGLATGGGDLTADRTITVPAAAAADVRAGTSSAKANTPAALAGAAAFITLTDAATVAWDVSTGFNAMVTLGGNRTIGAPTSLQDGVTYVLVLVQDATGSRVPSWNSIWDFGAQGAPTLQTAAGKRDRVVGQYNASVGKIAASFWKGA